MNYEVHFRGRNGFESGGALLDRSKGELRAWKPTPLKQFECDRGVAQSRFDELVRDGIAERTVDDVVPFVVVIYLVRYEIHAGHECRMLETMLWQYAEEGAKAEGSWVHGEA